MDIPDRYRAAYKSVFRFQCFLILLLRLRWGWVFLERTRILSGIQFTTYLIEIFVVETKRLVGSFVNMILTRQTCGQRSSRATDSKRQASEFAICSQCQNVVRLCTTSGLAFGERSAMTNSDFSCVETRFFSGSRHCVAVLETQVPKLCTDLDLSLLYILILGTYSKFARKCNFPALGVCFPRAGRMFAVSRSRLQYCRRIVSYQQKIR